MPSDGLKITEGSGATVAGDLISGKVHTRQKLSLGADGSATDAPGDSSVGLWVDPRADIVKVSVTPTITAGGYASGESIGGEMHFAAVGADFVSGVGNYQRGAFLHGLLLTSKHTVTFACDLLLLRDAASTPPTNAATYAVDDTDVQKAIAAVSIATTDWVTFSSNRMAYKALDIPIGFPTSVDLYGHLVSRSATATLFSADGDLTVSLMVTRG